MEAMFSKIAIPQPSFFTYSSNTHGRAPSFICRMDIQSTSSSSLIGEKEEALPKPQSSANPHLETRKGTDLQFSKLQPLDRDINQESRYTLLQPGFVRKATGRIENERYANNYKRQFTEQEYNALKRRCKGYHGQQSTCIITVKKEDKNIRCTILKSVVATLDLSIRYLLQGESFPGERVQPPLFCNIERKEASRYSYVANLCVAKSARRKGIAINMLKLAIESAKSKDADTLFVHVHRNNTPARQLYQKLGFEIIDVASLQLQEEQMYLLCCKT